MKSDATKNKMIYFLALGSMCTLLILVMYNFFYRTIEIDIMKYARLVYTGENGSANVTVVTKTEDFNQRTQEFLDSIEFEVSPDNNLSNGDIIHVTATYDDILANQYHYKSIHTEEDFVVEGLNNRFESKDAISSDYLDDILKQSETYIKEHAQQIYDLDPTIESKESPKLNQSKILYSTFLKSKSNQTSDRILSVFQLDYKAEDSIQTIYYLVCVPNINDGNVVQTQDIYGEKAYLSQEEFETLNFEQYIDRIFNSQYTIEKLDITTEEIPTENE